MTVQNFVDDLLKAIDSHEILLSIGNPDIGPFTRDDQVCKETIESIKNLIITKSQVNKDEGN